ncbi:MAG: hypothetical protein ACRETR_12640 [Steroidobacteraceae bacterium]
MTAALAGGSVAGHAGDPPQQTADAPVDLGLLEFLGNGDPSSDSDDASWLAYLTKTNIGKVAKASQAPQKPVPQKPAQQKPASAPGNGDKPSG